MVITVLRKAFGSPRVLTLCVALVVVVLVNAGPQANGLILRTLPSTVLLPLSPNGSCRVDARDGIAHVGTVQIGSSMRRACRYKLFCNTGLGRSPGSIGFEARCLTSSQSECPDYSACMHADYQDVNVIAALEGVEAAAFREPAAIGDASVSPYSSDFPSGRAQVQRFLPQPRRVQCVGTLDGIVEHLRDADVFGAEGDVRRDASILAETYVGPLIYEGPITASERASIEARGIVSRTYTLAGLSAAVEDCRH